MKTITIKTAGKQMRGVCFSRFCLTATIAAIMSMPSSTGFAPQRVVFRTNLATGTSTILMAKRSAADDGMECIRRFAAAAAFSLAVFANPSPSFADGQTKEFKLPPIDFADKSRCTLNSSKMGQANAARDKLYDLRQCDLSGQDASGFDLSGVIMTKTNLAKAKFIESQFSKGYLHDSTFDEADFTNAVVDRASFKGSSLRGVIFKNAVLTGTSFEGADVENADFTEAYIGDFDIRNLCKNPTLKGENPVTGAESRISAGCVGKNQ